ncbi:MAG: hypothetical protein A2806_00580 [Candidatus Terrybacteria bacterium RIFCSPHIGHO2_01_FULL_48_17]|uniref:PIG-L family deacetylase n=1 Tax=Candidatus Terrybacteria bacterium RIFCSPHIGHO2_01_FULL_48_17 TaxID=1802362 RepID=A0A1G2PIG1_9BACT|nr:MAG: hypothetical protein A2806_00580 [Candidatus Terrybacteria bacterium RIFCSPHIGHO2_01_FULL_48_17]OHA53839.1 MAG: hypothetical protein A3A30_01175 [Candidatus Terrybacteria bacterium RIFCSPLOWO2_01_FULL_48_14]
MKQFFWKNKTVLAVNAHPDDLHFMAGATLAKASQEGARVYCAVFTNGNKGNAGNRKLRSSQLVTVRRKEQLRAAKVLGVAKVFFFGYPDCELTPTMTAKKKLVRLIRRLKPDTVIGLDPSRYYSPLQNMVHHADHRAAGEITLDACYPLCRDRLCMPDAGPPHNIPYVFLVTLDDANYFENITKTLDTKIQALSAHKSQIADMQQMPRFVRRWAAQCGKKSKKYRFAESFRRISF